MGKPFAVIACAAIVSIALIAALLLKKVRNLSQEGNQDKQNAVNSFSKQKKELQMLINYMNRLLFSAAVIKELHDMLSIIS